MWLMSCMYDTTRGRLEVVVQQLGLLQEGLHSIGSASTSDVANELDV